MSSHTREWLCVGRACLKARAPLRLGVTGSLQLARAAFPVRQQRWIRYEHDLADIPPPPPGVQLTPVTDAMIGALRLRPDRAESRLKSGLRFWDEGLRRAYMWMADEAPLCIQWLLTSEDNPRLRRLKDWSGLYPPVPAGWGQLDHLFVFPAARLGMVATGFEQTLFDQARQLGLRGLITHIREGDVAWRQWVECTGWRRYGTITRYQVGRLKGVYLHRNGGS